MDEKNISVATMDSRYIANKETGYFSKIITDYLEENEQLKPFYQHPVSIEGIEQAIAARQQFPQNREVLVAELKKQYQTISVSPSVGQNMELLLQNDSFTITTAHQPNIFTGPLYFIYKILHVIKLSLFLSRQFPLYNFIPVYYMGSEDADLEELGEITINGNKYQWQTRQSGAVGRMKVDKAFMQLIERMSGQLGTLPYGPEIVSLFKKCYREGSTIQQSTLEVVNELFQDHGLIIVNPDNANLKRLFNPVVKKELTSQFSHHQISQTIEELERHYKVQTAGRELNLFYLIDDKRERIELRENRFEVLNLGLSFSLEDICEELEAHPERFSANVVLRGIFQETILPNIAFIGGGGELAYWLELKACFNAVSVPYPVLILRNSFLLLTQKQQGIIKKLGFEAFDFFKSEEALVEEIVKRSSEKQLTLQEEIDHMNALYHKIKKIAGETDITLEPHVESLKSKAERRLKILEKKMLKAERRKFHEEQQQIHKVKSFLFPGNNLQERVENLAGFYGVFGKNLIEILLESSLALDQKFGLLVLEAEN